MVECGHTGQNKCPHGEAEARPLEDPVHTQCLQHFLRGLSVQQKTHMRDPGGASWPTPELVEWGPRSVTQDPASSIAMDSTEVE